MDFTEAPQLNIQEEKNHAFSAIYNNTVLRVDQSFIITDIEYRRSLKHLYVFEIIGALCMSAASFIYFFYELSTIDLAILQTLSFWISRPISFFLWFGILGLVFIWYRTLANKKVQKTIAVASQKKKKQEQSVQKTVIILKYFTPEANETIENAVHLAADWNSSVVTPEHVFAALLDNVRIANMFVRLAVPVASLRDMLERSLRGEEGHTSSSPKLNNATRSILFQSYAIALSDNRTVVDVTELVMATIQYSEKLQEVLYDLEVEYQKVENMLLWLRTQEDLRQRHSKQVRGAAHVNKHGIDRAMTAIATPFLNNYSRDLTLDVKYGRTEPCVAREKEINHIFQIIESGRPNIALIGERGVGKRAIIEGIAARMVIGDVPKLIHDKRIVELSTSSLVAGTTVSGAQERLLRIVYEVQKAGNIILFIDNLHELINPGEVGIDISKTLAEVTADSNFITFTTTTPTGYTQFIANSAIGSTLADVDVDIMDDNQAIQVLESKAPYIEYKQNVFFSYQAIATSVTLARKFLQQQVIPESAVGLLTEAASVARSVRGDNALVQAEDVAQVVSNKTGVPVSAISDDESKKLLQLEEEMHERVIGQTEAVQMVASALRRARASIRENNRPIANFMFLGPTGVGKTELAKTIADVYFGGEERMIRIDMSEYQDTTAVAQLIGQTGKQGTGILTEAVRAQPFSLILLDEMEKADPNVLNIFLQVFDDGRLTDSVGRVVDFSNTIIIATSNAGTSYVQEQLSAGTSYETIQHELLHGGLQEYYRPEFLNRFDAIILFQSLTSNNIKNIAKLMLKRVAKDLEVRGIGLDVDDAALEDLAEVGFDPEFGARPMRRAIQDHIENQIADLILQRAVKRRDTIIIQKGLSVVVKSA